LQNTAVVIPDGPVSSSIDIFVDASKSSNNDNNNNERTKGDDDDIATWWSENINNGVRASMEYASGDPYANCNDAAPMTMTTTTASPTSTLETLFQKEENNNVAGGDINLTESYDNSDTLEKHSKYDSSHTREYIDEKQPHVQENKEYLAQLFRSCYDSGPNPPPMLVAARLPATPVVMFPTLRTTHTPAIQQKRRFVPAYTHTFSEAHTLQAYNKIVELAMNNIVELAKETKRKVICVDDDDDEPSEPRKKPKPMAIQQYEQKRLHGREYKAKKKVSRKLNRSKYVSLKNTVASALRKDSDSKKEKEETSWSSTSKKRQSFAAFSAGITAKKKTTAFAIRKDSNNNIEEKETSFAALAAIAAAKKRETAASELSKDPNSNKDEEEEASLSSKSKKRLTFTALAAASELIKDSNKEEEEEELSLARSRVAALAATMTQNKKTTVSLISKDSNSNKEEEKEMCLPSSAKKKQTSTVLQPTKKKKDTFLEEYQWNAMFHLLLRFKKKENHCDVPLRYIDESKKELGAWVDEQRLAKEKGHLSKKFSCLLEREDFSWKRCQSPTTIQKKGSCLKDNFSRLLEQEELLQKQKGLLQQQEGVHSWLIKEEDPPSSSNKKEKKKKEEDRPSSSNKKKEMKTDEGPKERLSYCSEEPTFFEEYQFNVMYSLLLRFKKRTKLLGLDDYDVPLTYVDEKGIPLGAWVEDQRLAMERGCLKEKFVRLLQKENFPWKRNPLVENEYNDL